MAMPGVALQVVTETACPGCLSSAIAPLERSFLSQCGDCGLVFDNPRPTPEAISDYYNQNDKYDHWLVNLEDREKMWKRRLEKMKKFHRPGSLLDVGSGIGQFLALAKSYGYGPVYGTEVSRIGVSIAKERFGIDMLAGEIGSLDLPTVENLTLFHVLEHVHQPLAFLRRCHELLTPGGTITVAVPNDFDYFLHKPGIQVLAPITLQGEEIHLSHFTTKSLQTVMQRAGFTVVDVSLDPYWTPDTAKERMRYSVLSSMHRLTGRNLYPTIWITARRSN